MAKQQMMWVADDGSTWATEQEAAIQDVKFAKTRLIGEVEGYLSDKLDDAGEYWENVGPYTVAEWLVDEYEIKRREVSQ